MPFVCKRAAHRTGHYLIDSETPFPPGGLESKKEVILMSRARRKSELFASSHKQGEESKGLSRRSLLKNVAGAAVGAAAASLTAPIAARAHPPVLSTPNHPPPTPLP